MSDPIEQAISAEHARQERAWEEAMTPDPKMVEALNVARAWIFECWGWLMETGLDMTCPMETDPLDIVEQIDALIGVDSTMQAECPSKVRGGK